MASDPFMVQHMNAPRSTAVDNDPFMSRESTANFDAQPNEDIAGDPFLSHDVPAERTRPSSNVDRDVFLGQVSRTGPPPVESVTQDPFMTEVAPPDAIREMEGTTQDPFMTESVSPSAIREMAGTTQDPFLTHAHGVEPDQKHYESVVEDPFLAHGEPRVFVKDPTIWDVVGYGDVHREKWVLRFLVIFSWLIFILVMSSWLIMRHFNQATNVAFTVVVFLASTIMSLSYFRARTKKQFPLASLGLLCLLAAVLGLACGLYGWDLSWRQLWWFKTGRHVEAAEAETPAWIAADAATLAFNEVLAGRPVPTVKTSVAYSYTGGFRKDGHMYCVAPLLNEEVLKSNPPIIRVNYWAVGTDCCRSYDGFHCGASRSWKGSNALVMVDDFIPCLGCSKDGMKQAVAKAEVAHGLVSATGAKFVKWVEDTNAAKSDTRWTSAIFFIVACLGALIIIILVALVLWYYGVGKMPIDGEPTALTKLLGAAGYASYV